MYCSGHLRRIWVGGKLIKMNTWDDWGWGRMSKRILYVLGGILEERACARRGVCIEI